MSKTNSGTLNTLCTLFGARAASRIFKQWRGRASHILEEAGASYGAGWDAIRAVHALMEQAFLETPAAEIIDSSSSCRKRKVCRAIEPETAKASTEKYSRSGTHRFAPSGCATR